jgi:hypothetical protein
MPTGPETIFFLPSFSTNVTETFFLVQNEGLWKMGRGFGRPRTRTRENMKNFHEYVAHFS